MRAFRLLIAAGLAALVYAPAAQAALTFTPLPGDFSAPIYLTSPPGDTQRQFVVQRGGAIRVVKDGNLTPQPFVTVPHVFQGGEGGLLSMAFHPKYGSKRRFYVYYVVDKHCVSGGCPIRVDEFKVSATDPDVADPASQRKIIEIPHPDNTNHVGGQLAFGPDGYLYIATGDGGSGNDPPNNAQNTKVLLGKMLRLDPRRSATRAYRIPPGNPYVGVPGKNEIYAIGLRNPFRFSFDHLTGALVIGDVGQGRWEEIDYAPSGGARGKNFGWKTCEGTHLSGQTAACTLGAGDNYLGPTFDYEHRASAPHLCGITGGFVSRDNSVPETLGKYLFTDICQGDISSIDAATGTGGAATGLSFGGPYSFGQDGLCRLYAINGGGGEGSVLRIDSTAPGAPGCQI